MFCSYRITDAARGFLFLWMFIGPTIFFRAAPFGRFAPSSDKGTLDGNTAWMIMESVGPLVCLGLYLSHPLSNAVPPLFSPATLLLGLYFVHYANRALISPLRTPVRSRASVDVPIAACVFNSLNGSLMGSYLSSTISPDLWLRNLLFWPGVALFCIGLAGNIWHDEILLQIRRQMALGPDGKPHYAIPYGWMYHWVSYPNYLCEWFEWLGFAVAACPQPNSLAAPWLFLIAEVAVMLPRAVTGHQWYHRRFKDYPKKRKAIIPFIL
ncbi:3-oxo-5-alpha-steroid 4-dehydrogenase-domain-containing protein [Auriculariales sp. MPI-PUGE-AT-0066]|nr:3-oxo-5-alpha-steroid 4-dehydrogenase-domain-containing protein [Auriculariales sp. MPI-PUGE-AT-0066]